MHFTADVRCVICSSDRFSLTVHERKHSWWFLQNQVNALVYCISSCILFQPLPIHSKWTCRLTSHFYCFIRCYPLHYKGTRPPWPEFSGEKFKSWVNNKTRFPSLNPRFKILLSCHLLLLALYNFVFSYTSSCISSNSLNNNFIFSLSAW